jgi:isopropylmalate/homocitrate/citramalate synthase
MQHASTDLTPHLSEIILDPKDRWWVSRLNCLSQVQLGISLPERIHIRDCTLREGEETPGTKLSQKQKLLLARMIQEVGIREIEIGYCGAIDQHRNLARLFRDAGLTLKLSSLNRAYARDGEWQAEIEGAVQEGVDCISLITFCNNDLLSSVPWLPQEAVPERVFECVSYARQAGVEVMATLAGASRTGLHWIDAFARAAASAGANVIGIADSMGCALPETVAFLVRFVRDSAGLGPAVAFHGHNTFGLATANALAAIRAGAQTIDTVPLGLGEGAGIAPLEEIVYALEVLYGVETGLDVEKVADLCRQVKQVFGVEYPPTKTFIGDGLYRHSIDSHIASILRGSWHTWECVHPSVLGQERQLEFGFAKIRRGRSGAVAAKIEQMGLEADDEQLNQIIEDIQAVTQVRSWASEAEVEGIIRRVLKDAVA